MSDHPQTPTEAGRPAWNIPLPASTASAALAVEAPQRRSFGGRVWRFLVAIKDGLSLLFLLLFFIIIAALLSATPNKRSGSTVGALVLRFNGVVTEQLSDPDPLAALSGGPLMNEFRTRDVVHVINSAATNSNVKAIVLDLDGFLGGGQVSLSEIGTALQNARASKPVLSFATAYSGPAYQLAASGTEIWTDPIGGATPVGPGGSRLYYKGLLDKLGVTANIYRVGTFKSAVEPFMRADQSAEAREAELAYASDIWENYLLNIERARPAAKIRAFADNIRGAVDQSGGNLALASKQAGLVDHVDSRMAFNQRVAKLAGTTNDDRPYLYKAIRYSDFLAANPVSSGGSAIAVVPVVGTIVDGVAKPGSAGGATVSKYILDAVADKNVKAIVLRVDSPGGSVLASEEIRQALLAAKAKKLPIIVSMANLAASGGYWVSTPADQIIADPATITGSIGVFGILPSFETALAKIGVTSDGIKTTQLSGQPDLFGGVNEDFNAIMQASVEQIYGRFTALVADSRKLPKARVEEIAEGRVWSGAQAERLGLVDKLGSLQDAVVIAADEAGVTNYHTKYFEPAPSSFNVALAALLSDNSDETQQTQTSVYSIAGWQNDLLQRQLWSDLNLLLDSRSVMASCLECGAYRPVQASAPEMAPREWMKKLAALWY